MRKLPSAGSSLKIFRSVSYVRPQRHLKVRKWVNRVGFAMTAKRRLPSHVAKLVNLIGLNIYGTDHRSPASLTRVKIGNMCIGASGNTRIRSCGPGCQLPPGQPLPSRSKHSLR
jgi:hypothetical protein